MTMKSTLQKILDQPMLAVDIETECALPDCELTYSQCMQAKHALIPHENRVTVVGTWGPKEGDKRVFRGSGALTKFYKFIKKKCDNEGYKLLFHEGRFDVKVLSYHLFNYDDHLIQHWGGDTKLLAYVITKKIPQSWLANYELKRKELNKTLPRGVSHRAASLHSLKTLAPYFLGVEPFWEDPTNHDNDDYVLRDVEYTYRLYYELANKATNEEIDFYFNRQFLWARELLKAELKGVRIDNEKLYKKQGASEQSMKKALDKVYKNWNLGDDFNLNSPKQLLSLLKDSLGYECRNFDGKESTDKEVLNRLATKHDDVKDLLDYRKHMKLSSTYYPSYRRFQTNAKRIHCGFNTSDTRTGRLSSSFPNLQNQPSETRDLFVSDPGTSFVIRDLSGVEPVLIAHYTRDSALLRIVKDPALNFHNAVTPLVFPYTSDCPNNEIKQRYKAERDVTKTADLAIFYGSGAKRLHTILFKAGFTDYSLADCKQIVKRIREHFKGVWDFKKNLDTLLKQGYTIHNILGRPVKIQNPEDVYMKGFNRLIQGSGSDIVLEAIRLYNKWCCNEGIDSQAIIAVHDEILAQAPDEYIERCTYLLEIAMTTAVDLGDIKLEVEGEISKEWVK